MDPLTHLATGVICSQLLPGPSRWWAALAGAIFAVLPDVDYFFIYWDRLAFIRYHRGFTHSLVAVPLLALAGALLGRVLGGPRWFRPLLILGIVVLASHLLLDLATSYGTQLLSPFSRRRFSLDWIFIIDPYFTALLLAGTIAALAFPLWGPRAGAGFLAAAAALSAGLRLLSPPGPGSGPPAISGGQPRGANRGRPAPTLFLPPLATDRRGPGRNPAGLCAAPLGGRPGAPGRRGTGAGGLRRPEPGLPGPGQPLPGSRAPDHPDLEPGPGGRHRLFPRS